MGEVNKVRKAKDSEKIKNLVDQWVRNKEYLMHDIGVEKLGKVLGINRTYISNYINDTYQTNFNTWIHKMRIAEAQRLIMENPQTALGQIASMTGILTRHTSASNSESLLVHLLQNGERKTLTIRLF